MQSLLFSRISLQVAARCAREPSRKRGAQTHFRTQTLEAALSVGLVAHWGTWLAPNFLQKIGCQKMTIFMFKKR